jgi:hypothetical protein
MIPRIEVVANVTIVLLVAKKASSLLGRTCLTAAGTARGTPKPGGW